MHGDTKIPALAFADDIVLLASNPQKLQALINVTFCWCTKNDIHFNLDKTKVMHIRHKRRPRSSFGFQCGNNEVKYCDEYKYLGLWINEHLDTKEMVRKVNLAARRALGSLVGKVKALVILPTHISMTLWLLLLWIIVVVYGVSSITVH